jgi:hypothetical protein
MNIHLATISVAVMDSAAKLILESILETKDSTILQFLGGLRGSLQVTFEVAELLHGNHLSPIYQGENGLRTLKELARTI